MTENELKQIVFNAQPAGFRSKRCMGWRPGDTVETPYVGFVVLTPNKIDYANMLPIYNCAYRSYIRRWLNENARDRVNMGDRDAIVCMAYFK